MLSKIRLEEGGPLGGIEEGEILDNTHNGVLLVQILSSEEQEHAQRRQLQCALHPGR